MTAQPFSSLLREVSGAARRLHVIAPQPLQRWMVRAPHEMRIVATIQHAFNRVTATQDARLLQQQGQEAEADEELPPEAGDLFEGRDVETTGTDTLAKLVLDRVEARIRGSLTPKLARYALALHGSQLAGYLALVEGAGQYVQQHARELAARQWPIDYPTVSAEVWRTASGGQDLFGSVESVNAALRQLGPILFDRDIPGSRVPPPAEPGILRIEAKKNNYGDGYSATLYAGPAMVDSASEKTRRGVMQALILGRGSFGQLLVHHWLLQGGGTWATLEKLVGLNERTSAADKRHAQRAAQTEAAREVERVRIEQEDALLKLVAARWIKRTRALVGALSLRPLKTLRDLKVAIPAGFTAEKRGDSYLVRGPPETDLPRDADVEAPQFSWVGHGHSAGSERSLRSLVDDAKYRIGRYPDVPTLIKAMGQSGERSYVPHLPLVFVRRGNPKVKRR